MLHSNTIRRSALAVVAATLSIGMMACNNTKTPGTTPTVSSVTLSASPASVAIGATSTVTATVTGTNSPSNKVTFSVSGGGAFASITSTTNNTASVKGVAAGTATIKACSTVDSTKCATTTVVVTGGTTTGPTAAFNVQFNEAGAPIASGFTADTGAGFNGTSGWVTEASGTNPTTTTALNMSTAMRYRNPTDTTNIVQGLATEQYGLALLHCTACSSSTQQGPAAWEYKVNNGKYDVTVSVGDADKRNTDSNYVVNVEGVKVIGPVAPTAGQILSATKTSITVNDGFLTVDSIGGTNTKINYIKVTPSAVQ